MTNLVRHVNSNTHPLPVRHELPCLEAFRVVYENWDSGAELSIASNLAMDDREQRGVLELFTKVSNLLEHTVSFAYLYDSLLQCSKNNDRPAASNRNICAMMYQVARGYKQIDQGWIFLEVDLKDGGVFVNEKTVTKVRHNGYTGSSLDDFLLNNRTVSLATRFGVSKIYKSKELKSKRRMIYAINDLMGGYWVEFKEVCKHHGVNRSDVENDCSDLENMWKLGLRRTLPTNFGMQRYDVIARYAATDGRETTHLEAFKTECREAPTLLAEAKEISQALSLQVEPQRQQQEAVRTAEASKKKARGSG